MSVVNKSNAIKFTPNSVKPIEPAELATIVARLLRI